MGKYDDGEFVFRWGKHKGLSIRQVPDDYLEFLVKSQATVDAAREEAARRKYAEEASLPMVEKLIRAGRNSLAKSLHPDAGGTTEMMQELNAAVEMLRELVKRGTE